MKHPGFVIVRESLHDSEAQVIVGLLASEGIEAVIDEDDAGHMLPSLDESRGVRVLVPEGEAARAAAILTEYENDDGEEDEGEDEDDDEGE